MGTRPLIFSLQYPVVSVSDDDHLCITIKNNSRTPTAILVRHEERFPLNETNFRMTQSIMIPKRELRGYS
jgi:hypothetical protein